eukprot:5885368-Prymnesium_polylepis.2
MGCVLLVRQRRSVQDPPPLSRAGGKVPRKCPPTGDEYAGGGKMRGGKCLWGAARPPVVP